MKRSTRMGASPAKKPAPVACRGQRQDTTILQERADRRLRIIRGVGELLVAIAIIYGWIIPLALVGE